MARKKPLDITIKCRVTRPTDSAELVRMVQRAADGLRTPGFRFVGINWQKGASRGERFNQRDTLIALQDFSRVLKYAAIRVAVL